MHDECSTSREDEGRIERKKTVFVSLFCHLPEGTRSLGGWCRIWAVCEWAAGREIEAWSAPVGSWRGGGGLWAGRPVPAPGRADWRVWRPAAGTWPGTPDTARSPSSRRPHPALADRPIVRNPRDPVIRCSRNGGPRDTRRGDQVRTQLRLGNNWTERGPTHDDSRRSLDARPRDVTRQRARGVASCSPFLRSKSLRRPRRQHRRENARHRADEKEKQKKQEKKKTPSNPVRNPVARRPVESE